MTGSSNALKAVATGQVAKKPGNFPAMLDAYKGEIARALPKHLNADTMARVALTCFRMNPKLAECQPASVFAAVIQASQLGLRPGLLGECYLIPYKEQCTLQLGYQGLLELARRSGLVESIGAYLVHEKDDYRVQFGTDPGVTHQPCLDGDPGPVKFGYAVAKLKGGGTHVEVMTLREIQAIRDRSQNVQSAKKYGKKTPWDTDFDEMARKTLIRRICKYLPKSNELATAIALDDAAGSGNQVLNVDDAIAGTFVPPAIEGESVDKPSEPLAAADDRSAGAPADEFLNPPEDPELRRAAMREADRKLAAEELPPAA
jgi:recombination protein RecT